MSSHPSTTVLVSPRPVNRKVMNPIFPKMAKAITEDVRYIFSINADGFPPIHRTHSVTVIFPADRVNVPDGVEIPEATHSFGEIGGVKYSRTTVHGRIELCDSGIEDKFIEVATEAELIAQDITDWCNQDMPRTSRGVPSFSGVWWSEHLIPNEKTIKQQRQRMREYNLALIAEADKFNETAEGKANINDGMRRAARAEKVERTWLYEAVPQNTCPACLLPVPAGAAVCGRCHAVIDEEKAKRFFPERFRTLASTQPEAQAIPKDQARERK